MSEKNKEEIKTTSQPAGAREFCWECRDWLGQLTLTTAQAAFHELHTLRQQTATLTDKFCKIQDDIASLISTHRSDWSWNDVVEDVKKLLEKQTVNEVTIGWLTKIVREQKGIIDLQTEVIEDLLKNYRK